MPADTLLSQRRSLAGRKAALSRSRTEDDPEYRAVSEGLAYEGLAEHAARVVADWPTPPIEVRERISSILRGGAA
jgi:hypothetical protein